MLLPTILVVCLAFNASKQKTLVCSALQVEIEPVQGVYFITQKDVETKIFSRFENLVGKPVKDIDLHEIEQTIYDLAHVAKAKVYTGIQGKLHAEITQRKPVVRFIYGDGNGFYLDNHGKVLPLSKNYTARVLVVNGKFSRNLLKSKSIEGSPLLTSVYNMAMKIREDAFLKSQIQQLYVNENQEFELIPRVGNHIIEFGDDSEMASKLENLKIFYLEGLAYKGWNRYSKVSLKYKDQVVCTKK